MKNYPYLREAVAATVDRLRRERRLTKTCLAELAELQDRYIYSINKGERNPTLGAIYSLCEALGTPVDLFVRQIEEERRRLLGATACDQSSILLSPSPDQISRN